HRSPAPGSQPPRVRTQKLGGSAGDWMLRKYLLGSVGLGALVFSAPVFAQDGVPDAGPGVTQLDTVTSVATRTPKTIFDTMGSVSTVTREEIERRMPSTFGDLVKDLPNVDIS